MFVQYTRGVGDVIPTEYIDCKIAVEVGQALSVANGVAVLATGANKPAYISQGRSDATSTARKIPVIRVDNMTVFETELSVASSAIAVGAKYTLAGTGDSITATTEGGVAEVVSFDGTAGGDKVRVRF